MKSFFIFASEIKTVNMEIVKIITHEELGDIIIYGSLEESMFLAGNVASLLGNSRARDMVERVDANEKMKLPFKMTSSQSTQNQWFLTKKGVIQCVEKSRVASISMKKFILESLDIENITVVRSFPETEFLSSIETIVSQLGYSLDTQRTVDGYKLDGYIPELKLAIEYDEEQHSSQYKADEERQLYIENKLHCSFVRCDIRNSKDFNIGLVMKNILNKIKLSV